jgi:hypothetical protein
MTFREKLQKEHPDKVGPEFRGGCFMCPVTYGYEDRDDRPCRNNSRTNCTECWNRVIPGTEESKTFNFKPEGLNALIERAATKRDVSVSIFITGDSTHISVYPCPDPSEKQGNPVAEAYKYLVNDSISAVDARKAAVKKLEEALE